MESLAKERGCTILLVTHNDRIHAIANGMVDMEDGKLIADPSPIETT